MSDARQVIRTRSSASIYRPTCLANLVNATLWVAYGIVSMSPAAVLSIYVVLDILYSGSDCINTVFGFVMRFHYMIPLHMLTHTCQD